MKTPGYDSYITSWARSLYAPFYAIRFALAFEKFIDFLEIKY